MKNYLYMLIALSLLVTNLTPAGTISGYVRDSTSSGVDNALVYFSNTLYGCSTDSLGYFTLVGIPDGQYWLTISKPGYLRKEVEIDVAGPDTVHLEIALTARAVELEGVDVWADSQTFENPWKSLTGLFFPGKTDYNYTIFNSSGKIPFGLLQLDTTILLYSLDTIIYEENCLLRLWILYANYSDRVQQFDPMHSLTLTIIGRQNTFQDIAPIPYRRIRSIFNGEDVIVEIQKRIGGEIKGQSGIHEIIEDRNSTVLKVFKFDWGKSLGVLNPVNQQELFTGSENAGILKPYFIHPGAGVHGYVYFIFPRASDGDSRTVQLEKFRYFITISLNTTVQNSQSIV